MASWILKVLVVIVLVLVALRFIPSLPITSVVTQKQDFFTVSGEGKVTAVPDTAVIELGINTSESSVKDAQSKANTVIASISTALQEMGINKADIKTTNYNVYPQYDYRPGVVNKINGYQVNANLSVTVREIDKANNVIDTATNKGANTVGGIQLTVNDDKQKELLQQAREEAVKEAKMKAESLAKAAGISLGKIINIQESSPSMPRPMFAMAEKAVGAGGGNDGTQIQPGSTDIVSSVTLFYETR